MIDSDNSDVILIESDDDDSGSGGIGPIKTSSSANAPSTTDADPHCNDLESPSSSSSSSHAPSSEGVIARRRRLRCDDPVANAIINLDDDINWDARSSSSSSSSSSSGIPSPWRARQARSSSDRPPSTVHAFHSKKISEPMKSSMIEAEYERSKKSCLVSSTNKAIHKKEDETSTPSLSMTEDDHSARAYQDHEPTKGSNTIAKKKNKPRKRRWGNHKKAASSAIERGRPVDTSMCDDRSSTSATSKNETDSAPPNEGTTADRHFHCYLLRSLDPDHPLKTYIGFTTHPQRRIRQHNGILKNAGARRTRLSGRPWTFVCVIHGFQDKITALQFEWAWQNVNKSKTFRDAVGDDKLANKMKRRYGPNARLEELRILLKECLPFCLYSLTVYFPERRYHDVFNGILKRGKNGNPYKKDDDETTSEHESLLSIEVCSLEDMPVGREATILLKKKKARQEAVRIQKREQKKSTNYEPDISDWLENAKLIAEEGGCWSDSLDDEVESNCVNLETIGENSSSVDMNNSNNDSMSSLSRVENDVDELSKEIFSLLIAPREEAPEDPEICDFSTISSTDETSSLDDNEHDAAVSREFYERFEKENRRENPQKFDSSANTAPSIGKMGAVVSNCDVVDLCNSP